MQLSLKLSISLLWALEETQHLAALDRHWDRLLIGFLEKIISLL